MKNILHCYVCKQPIERDRQSHIIGVINGIPVTFHSAQCRKTCKDTVDDEHKIIINHPVENEQGKEH